MVSTQMVLTPKQIAQRGTFLVKEVGSSVHGTNLEGVDDLDLMGVCFQPPTYLLGLQHFEQYIYRTAEERAKFTPDEDQRKAGRQPPSQPGDTDLVIYSVQKYLKLALSGNPSVLVFLFSPKRHPEFEMMSFDSGFRARNWRFTFENLAEAIASKQAGVKFLGYLLAQKERMLGMRGQMRVTRQALVDLYGYDTKYAMQALRLGLQGIEFMQTGRIQLPMPELVAESLKMVRRGEMTLSEIIEWINKLEEDLKSAIDDSILPKNPNYKVVNDWLATAQLEFFEWLREAESQPQEYLAKLP
jgi:hypothetical protein